MKLTEVYWNGYRKAQELYRKEQYEFLSVIAEARNMPVEWILKTSALFVPNDEFMLHVFGKEILDFDCYRGDACIWSNALIFPIRDVNDDVVGLAGFFPFDYLDDSADTNYYAYSSQKVMRKGNYLYFPEHNLLDAMDAGYLVLVDGIFDAVSLNAAGFHAAALMGSSVTQQILLQLKFIPRIILLADNDSAGYLLYNELRKHLSNVTIFKQGKTKDVDELLKSEYSMEFKKELQDVLNGRLLSLRGLCS